MSAAKDEMLVTLTKSELVTLLRTVVREELSGAPAPPPPKKYLDAKEICSHFGVSRSTLQTWISEGCPHIARGKVLRFELDLVEEWIRGRRPGLRSVKP